MSLPGQGLWEVAKSSGALDFSNASSIVSKVPYEIHLEGLTALGLLELMQREMPALAFWYDPSTVPNGGVTGGTLRFYDLSDASNSNLDIAIFRLPRRGR
jgi:hypothetical protein